MIIYKFLFGNLDIGHEYIFISRDGGDTIEKYSIHDNNVNFYQKCKYRITYKVIDLLHDILENYCGDTNIFLKALDERYVSRLDDEYLRMYKCDCGLHSIFDDLKNEKYLYSFILEYTHDKLRNYLMRSLLLAVNISLDDITVTVPDEESDRDIFLSFKFSLSHSIDESFDMVKYLDFMLAGVCSIGSTSFKEIIVSLSLIGFPNLQKSYKNGVNKITVDSVFENTGVLKVSKEGD